MYGSDQLLQHAWPLSPPLSNYQELLSHEAGASIPKSTGHYSLNVVHRLKSLVSKKKKRFQADGFDLDLSYISPRIIAMGFPAERLEGIYRNHIDEVSRFFELRHKNHYKIYHLCNERSINACRFPGPVAYYPFSDHCAPQFVQVISLCQDVRRFLEQDPENIVAINCKAGKGRTGVMVCACLMLMHEADDAVGALRLFGEKRTRNGRGVTIPSQQRYVMYYNRLLTHNLYYRPPLMQLKSIRIEHLQQQLHGIQCFDLNITVYRRNFFGESSRDLCKRQGFEETDKIYPNSSDDLSADRTLWPTKSVSIRSLSESNSLRSLRNDLGIAEVSSSVPISQEGTLFPSTATHPLDCTTQLSDATYVIQPVKPATVIGDFRIKIKAKLGMQTKKVGQCWLNTFFIADTSEPLDSNPIRHIHSLSCNQTEVGKRITTNRPTSYSLPSLLELMEFNNLCIPLGPVFKKPSRNLHENSDALVNTRPPSEICVTSYNLILSQTEFDNALKVQHKKQPFKVTFEFTQRDRHFTTRCNYACNGELDLSSYPPINGHLVSDL